MGSVDNEEGDEGVEADEARGTKQPSPRKREVSSIECSHSV